MATEETKPEAKKEQDVKLVKMVRGEEFPAPHAADVHPDEVNNYALGGWVRAN